MRGRVDGQGVVAEGAERLLDALVTAGDGDALGGVFERGEQPRVQRVDPPALVARIVGDGRTFARLERAGHPHSADGIVDGEVARVAAGKGGRIGQQLVGVDARCGAVALLVLDPAVVLLDGAAVPCASSVKAETLKSPDVLATCWSSPFARVAAPPQAVERSRPRHIQLPAPRAVRVLELDVELRARRRTGERVGHEQPEGGRVVPCGGDQSNVPSP